MKLLENRVAVVTGAAQGIGLAIASTFATHGASLVIADLNVEAAQDASVVLFLASDLASYITGMVLEVTGGRFM